MSAIVLVGEFKVKLAVTVFYDPVKVEYVCARASEYL